MKKRILSIVLTITLILGSISIFPVSSYAYNESQTLLSNVSTSDWMSVIRDDTYLTEITVPGTHDSCARKFHNEDAFGVMSGISKCQNLNITEQLDAGIRFLDVRCECDASSHSIKTVHGSTDCWNGDDYYYLDYVFQDVYNWLYWHPSETVFISIKEDDGDAGAANFTTSVFEYIHGYRSNDNRYFYGSDYVWQDHWYVGKAVPHLGDVRGKCVLFNRFDQIINTTVPSLADQSGQKIKWGDYSSTSWEDPVYVNLKNSYSDLTFHVQDHYKWSTDNKKAATQAMLSLGHYRGEYYINFSSTVSDSTIPNPQDLSKKVNPGYYSYTYEKTKPSGIFAMDFATSDLARCIILNNEGVCTVVEGTDGNITYNLNRKTGVLTISGTGAMNNYAYTSARGENGAGSTAPWGDQNKNAVFNGQYNTDLITSIVINEGVTSIGNYAFYGYDNVASVSIPSSVKSIGEGAFTKCSSLTSVDISSKYITSIGNYAFKDCTGLTSFTTSDKVDSIGTDAFSNCPSLVMFGKAGIYSQSYARDNSITYSASGEFNSDINWFVSKATYYEPFTSGAGGTAVTGRSDKDRNVEWVENYTAENDSTTRNGVVHFPYSINNPGNYVNTGRSALGGASSKNGGVTVSFFRAINGNYWGSGNCVTLAKDSNNYLVLNDDGTFIYKRNGSTLAECTSKTFTRTGESSDTHKWEYFTYTITDSTVKVYLNGEFVHQASGASGLISFLESESTLVYPGSRFGNGTATLELDEISIIPISIDDIEAAAMFATYTAPIIYESDQRPADADVKIYASNGYENVIYTHGTNPNTTTSGIKDAADYMFKGDLVADGDNYSAYIPSDTTALEGELYTTVSMNSKYSIWLSGAYDNYGNTLVATQISEGGGRRTYKLSGELSRGYSDGSDDDVELTMYLASDSGLIPETKYVHVTQHPVSAHAMAGIYRNWNGNTRDISIIFRADGSTGVSNTYYSGNYSYVHSPVCVGNAWRFASNYNADNIFLVGDGKMGDNSTASFPTTTNSDIVNAGAYAQSNSESNGNTGTVYTQGTTAHYYIDKSVLTANKTVGGVHLDGDGNTYHMNSVVTRLGAGGAETNYWWRNCWVYGQDGLGWNLTNDNTVAESIGAVSNYNTADPQKFGYTMPTITGYLDRGSSTYATQFSVGINHSSNEYCAQARVDYDMHIYDKSTLRNLVNSYEAENITGAWTSHEEWEAYLKALSDAYAVLNDYKDTTCPDANSDVYKKLVAAHRAITYTDRTDYETARSTIVSALPRNVLYNKNTFDRVFDFMHTELNNQESYDIHAGKIYFNLRFVDELELGDSLTRVEAAADSKTDAVQYDLDAIDDIKDEFYDTISVSETVDGTKYTYYAYYSQDSYDALVDKTIDDINDAYMHYSINTNSGNVIKEAANPFAGKDLSDGFTISFSKYCAYDEGWNTSLINFSTGNQSDNRYFIIMANGVVLFNDGNGGAGGWNNCYFDAKDNDYTNTTEAAWHDIDLVFYKNPSGHHMLAYYTDGMLYDRYDLSSIAASGYPNGVSSGNDGIFSFLADDDINLYYGASFTIYGTMGGTTECYLDKVAFYDSPVFPVERSMEGGTNDTRYINDITDSLGGEAVTGNYDSGEGGNDVHFHNGNWYGRYTTAYFPWSYDLGKNYVSTNATPFAYTYNGNGYSVSYFQRVNGNYWEDTQSITFAKGEMGEHKYLAIGTDGKIHYNNGNGGSDGSLSGARLFFDYTTKCDSVVKQTWQHITVSFVDDFHIKYYVNGSLAANITVSGTDEYNAAGGMMDFINSAGTKLYLGCYTSYWGTCSLSLDNVKCFNHALSEGEAAAIYEYETNGAPTPIYTNEFTSDIPEVVSGAAQWESSLSGRSGLLHIMSNSADGDVDIYVDGVLTSDTSSIRYGSEINAVYTGSSTPYGWDNRIVNSEGTTNSSFNGGECSFTLTGNSTLKYFASNDTVDLSKLQAAYSSANGLLMELDGKNAIYSNASLTELISSINGEVREYLSADARTVARYPMNVEDSANLLADEINSALEGLTVVEENKVDLSVYQALIEIAENKDDDIYEFDSGFDSYVSDVSSTLNGVSVEYESIEGESPSITAVKTGVTQQEVDDVNSAISTRISNSIRMYDVKLMEGTLKSEGGITFNNGTNVYVSESDKYRATYSTKLNLKADVETAWYMDFASNTTSRGKQYQGFGKSFSTPVFGSVNVYARQRSKQNPYKLTIIRRYDNSANEPVQLVDFTSSYTLPAAPAVANYVFNGYIVGGETKQAGAEITLSEDTVITASYTFSGEANCTVSATPLENGTGFSNSVTYNTRIELKGGDGAYGWVELIKDGKETNWRPFYIGANLVYYATESTTLKAVTKDEFDSYKFKLPAINNKQSSAILSSGKAVFNAQIVNRSTDDIVEYGLLVAKITTDDYELGKKDIILENVGTQSDYLLRRCKSTKLVGAKQFTINVSGLTGNIVSRGYIIYRTSAGLETVYSEPVYQTLNN